MSTESIADVAVRPYGAAPKVGLGTTLRVVGMAIRGEHNVREILEEYYANVGPVLRQRVGVRAPAVRRCARLPGGLKMGRLTGVLMAAVLLSFSAFAGEDVWDDVEHRYVDNEGVKIHYASIGEGPVVLFVHGFPDFWYSWNAQMAGLKDEFRCVAMDTRGYNESDKPEGVENYAIDVLLTDIEAVIADLGVDSVALVGHDWGGGLAWRYAMTRPDQVNRLVILNLTHPKGYMAVRANPTPQQAESMKYIERFQDPNAASMFNPQMVAFLSAGADAPDEVKARYVKAFEQSSFDAMLNYYRAAWPMFKGEVQVEIPDLTMPVLQFHGLKDSAVDKDGLRDTWNWIDADYTLVTIPEANHWVQREAADLVTETMRWWLKMRE